MKGLLDKLKPMSSSRGTLLTFLPFACFSVAIIMVLTVSASFGSNALFARALLAVSAGLCAHVLATAVLRKTGGPLTITFCTYFIWFFTLPGACHAAQNIFPFYGLSYDDGSILTAALLTFASMLSYWLAYFVVRQRSIGRSIKSPLLISSRVAAFALASALTAMALMLVAGIDNFIRRRADDLMFADATDSSAIQLLIAIPTALSTVALLATLRTRRTSKSGWLLFAILIVAPVFLIANYPPANARFVMFGTLIAIAQTLVGIHSLRLKAVYALAFPIGMFTIFPLVDQLTRGDLFAKIQFDPRAYLASHGDLDGFQSVINTIQHVGQHGLHFGYQLLGVIFFFVPRSLWPDKPQPTGITTATSARYDFVNISAPMPAEMYIDFGFLGAIIFSAAAGYWTRRLDIVAAQTHGEDTARDMLYAGLLGFTLILLRGSWMSVIGIPFAYACFVLLLSWYAGSRHKLTYQRHGTSR
jgi:hypothetical protein